MDDRTEEKKHDNAAVYFDEEISEKDIAQGEDTEEEEEEEKSQQHAHPQKNAPLITADAEAGPESTKGFHYYLDLHREFLTTKLASSDFTLVGYALIHKTDKSRTGMLDNAHMHADGILFSGDEEKIVEDKLFEKFRAMLIIYSGLHSKNCPIPDPIKLRLGDNGKLTPDEKIKFNAMATRIGQRLQEELKKADYQSIRHTVRYLGNGAASTPAAAPKSNTPTPPPRLLDPKEQDALLAQKTVFPEIAIIPGNIDLQTYQDHLIKMRTDPKKSAFIFPGNDGHAKQNGLHDIKGGGGLAAVAQNLGSAGIGTLSLPTTFYSAQTTASVNEMAKNEMAKLWEAVGRGYQLVLPVRNFAPNLDPNKQFFSAAHRSTLQNITGNTNLEPSFWGGIQSTITEESKQLPQYYTEELSDLQNFIKAWNNTPDKAARQALLNQLGQKDPDFRVRFEQGLRLAAAGQKPADTAAANPPPSSPRFGN